MIAIALGVGLALVCIWGSVLYLLQLVKIEELEKELNNCKNEKRQTKNN